MMEDKEGEYSESYNSYEVVINGVEYCIWWDQDDDEFCPDENGDPWDSAMCYDDETGDQIYDIAARSF